MQWIGKIMGAFLGLLIAGPIGLVIGALIGHFFDAGAFTHFLRRQAFSQFKQCTQPNSPFFQSIFPLMGYLAKTDGRVTEAEIKAAKKIMSQMRLNKKLTERAIRLFSIGKESGFNPSICLDSLRSTYGRQPTIIRLCHDILKQIALADGQPVHLTKAQALNQLAQRLGAIPFQFNFQDFDFSQFTNFHRQQQNRQYQRATPNPTHANPYSILGIDRSASDSDVKKSYRRLMSQYHPDKLVSKNLSKEQMKKATEKTQEIKSAYEQLKRERGF